MGINSSLNVTAVILKSSNSRCGRGRGGQGAPSTAGGNSRRAEVSEKPKSSATLRPSNPSSGYLPEKFGNTHLRRYTHPPLTTALPTEAEARRQCPSRGDRTESTDVRTRPRERGGCWQQRLGRAPRMSGRAAYVGDSEGPRDFPCMWATSPTQQMNKREKQTSAHS